MHRTGRFGLSSILILFFTAASPTWAQVGWEDAKEPDKRLVEAIEDLERIVRQGGPEAVTFPWDPEAPRIDTYAKPPEFASYWTYTPKIGEAPRVRCKGEQITSSIFVGTKSVGNQFNVENWRISWETKDDRSVATSKEVVQTFGELYIPLGSKEGKPFPRKVFEFEDMQLLHDKMRFAIPSGKMVLVEVEDKPLGAFVLGSGQLWFEPPTKLASDVIDSDREVQQLQYQLKVSKLDGIGFKNLVIWGHPEWMGLFLKKLKPKAVSDKQLSREAQEAFFERLLPAMRYLGLAFRGSESPICRLPDTSDFFFLEFDTPKHGLVSYSYCPSSVREICLAGRAEKQLSARPYEWFKVYCLYDEPGQRNDKTRHELEREDKEKVRTVSWSVNARFDKGKLDKVEKGKFETFFEYETLEPNAAFAEFEFWALEPTALSDAGGNDILFFDTGRGLLIPVEPVDCAARRVNMLYALGRQGGDIDWIRSRMDGWLPESGYLDCKTFEFKITVPEKFQVASVGKLLEEQVDAGYRTKHWVGEYCTRFPGFVIGEFLVLDGEADGKPIVVYSKDIAQAKKYVLPEIESSLSFYSKCLAEYPYSKLSVCPVNWSHGRGFASLVTVTGRHAVLGDRQAGLYCHEVSHQWWGNIVGWFSPDDQWLSEGFAEMSTLLYLQSARDNESVARRLKDWGFWAKKLDEKGAVCLGGYRLGDAYFHLTYGKGGYVMHMLRMMVGDEEFLRILRTFIAQFKWKRATTSDFREVCERALGPDRLIELGGEPSLSWFFDQWIYGNGYPKYEFSWDKKRSDDGAWQVRCKVRQVGEELFKMPVPIWVWTKDGNRYVSSRLVHEKEHDFVLPVPSEPKKVELDTFNSVLCDIKEVKAD